MPENIQPKQVSKKNTLHSGQEAEKRLRHNTSGSGEQRHKKLGKSMTPAELLIARRRYLSILNSYLIGNAKDAQIDVARYYDSRGCHIIFPDLVFCQTCGDLKVMGDKCLNCATKSESK